MKREAIQAGLIGEMWTLCWIRTAELNDRQYCWNCDVLSLADEETGVTIITPEDAADMNLASYPTQSIKVTR